MTSGSSSGRQLSSRTAAGGGSAPLSANSRVPSVVLPPTPQQALSPKGKRPALSEEDSSEIGGEEEKKKNKKRKRTGFACLACRKRRTKCDGKEPCSACEYDPKDCLYPNAQVSVKYVQELEAKVRALETTLSDVRTGPSPSPSVASEPAPVQQQSLASSLSVPSRSLILASPTFANASLRVSNSASSWERTGHDGVAIELLEAAAAILAGEPSPEQPSHTPQEPVGVHNQPTAAEASGTGEDGLIDLSDKTLVFVLLEWYFGRVQYTYPVLHWPTFWGRYVRGEYESKPVLFATLHLVLAIAATMRAALGDEQLAARFFARAQLSGTELLLTADMDTLSYLCLLCFFSQSCSKNSLSSNAVAHTVFMARGLIVGQLTAALSPTEQAMRRRCWGAVRQAVATSSAISFRAATTWDVEEDIDAELELIGNDDDDEAAVDARGDNKMVFFRETVKLFKIKGRILASANDPAALATREIELLAFWDAVPVQFKQTTNASSIIKQQANILHARTLNATILLHRPALLASVSQTDPAPLKRESVLSAVSRSSSGSCVKAAVELLTHVSGTWSTTCHGNWWSSVGYEYSACLVVLAYQISQRIRGKDAAAFLDPPVLDHQASAAVTAGLNTLHGLSHVNQGLSSEDLRASPDMIQAAGRSYSIISRLRDVLLNSYNATPMSDLPLFGSSWDLAAAAYPSIPDDPFRSTWEGDDTFVNDILQMLGPQ